MHDESPLVTSRNPTGKYSEWAGSVRAYIGNWKMGVSYANVDFPKVYGLEYVSSGVARNFGKLEVGAGVETFIVHQASSGGERYTTNMFAGARYKLAPGLIVALGVGNLDADNDFNTISQPLPPLERRRMTNAVASVKVEF